MAKYHYREDLTTESARNNNISGRNRKIRKEDVTETSFVIDKFENVIKSYNQKTLSRKNYSTNIRLCQQRSVHLMPSDLSKDSFNPTPSKKTGKLTRGNEKSIEITTIIDRELDNNKPNIVSKSSERNVKTISDDYFFVVPISEISNPEAPKNILKRLKEIDKICKQQTHRWSQNNESKKSTPFKHGDFDNIRRRENNNRDFNGQTKKPVKKIRRTLLKNEYSDGKQVLSKNNKDVEKIKFENREKWAEDSFHSLRENVIKFVSNNFPYNDRRLDECSQIGEEQEIKITGPTKFMDLNNSYKMREHSKENSAISKKGSECLGQNANVEVTKIKMARCKRFSKDQHKITKHFQNYQNNNYNFKYAECDLPDAKPLRGKKKNFNNNGNNLKDNTINNKLIQNHDGLGSDVLILKASDSQFFKITDFLKIKRPFFNSKSELKGKLMYESELTYEENCFPKVSKVDKSDQTKSSSEKRNPIRFSLDSLKDVLVYTGKIDESAIKRLRENFENESFSNLTSRVLYETDVSLESSKSYRKRQRRKNNHQFSHDTKVEQNPSMLESDRSLCKKNLKRKQSCTLEYISNERLVEQSNKSSFNEPLKQMCSKTVINLELDPLQQSASYEPSRKMSNKYFDQAGKDMVSDKTLPDNCTQDEIEINDTKYSGFKITENEQYSNISTVLTNFDKGPLPKRIHHLEKCISKNNNKSQYFTPNDQILNKLKTSVSTSVQTDLQLLNESEAESHYLKNTKGTITSDLDQYIYKNKRTRSQIEKASSKFVQTGPLSLTQLCLHGELNSTETVLKTVSNTSILPESDILERVPIISEPDEFFEDFISYKKKKIHVGNEIDKASHHQSKLPPLQCTEWQYLRTSNENNVLKENLVMLEEPLLLAKFMNGNNENEVRQSHHTIICDDDTIYDEQGQCLDLDKNSKIGMISSINYKDYKESESPITLKLKQTSEECDKGVKLQRLQTQSSDKINNILSHLSMDKLQPSVLFKLEKSTSEASALAVKRNDILLESKNRLGMKSPTTFHSIARIDLSCEEIKPESPSLIEKENNLNSGILEGKHQETEIIGLRSQPTVNNILTIDLSCEEIKSEFPRRIEKEKNMNSGILVGKNPETESIGLRSQPTISNILTESELIEPNTSCEEERLGVNQRQYSEFIEEKSENENDYTDKDKLRKKPSVHRCLEELPDENDNKSLSAANISLKHPNLKPMKYNLPYFDLVQLNISIRAKGKNDAQELESLPFIPYMKNLILRPINGEKYNLNCKDEKYNQESTESIDLNAHCLEESIVLQGTNNAGTVQLPFTLASENRLETANREIIRNASRTSVISDKRSWTTQTEVVLYQTNCLEIATLVESNNASESDKRSGNCTKNVDKTIQTGEIDKVKKKTKTSIMKKLNRLFLCHYFSYIPLTKKLRKLGRKNIPTVNKEQQFTMYSMFVKCYARNQCSMIVWPRLRIHLINY